MESNRPPVNPIRSACPLVIILIGSESILLKVSSSPIIPPNASPTAPVSPLNRPRVAVLRKLFPCEIPVTSDNALLAALVAAFEISLTEFAVAFDTVVTAVVKNLLIYNPNVCLINLSCGR